MYEAHLTHIVYILSDFFCHYIGCEDSELVFWMSKNRDLASISKGSRNTDHVKNSSGMYGLGFVQSLPALSAHIHALQLISAVFVFSSKLFDVEC